MIYFVGLHCGYQLLHTCVISLTKILNGTNWASCQETMSSREMSEKAVCVHQATDCLQLFSDITIDQLYHCMATSRRCFVSELQRASSQLLISRRRDVPSPKSSISSMEKLHFGAFSYAVKQNVNI